ncbi:hypothetical protein [Nocardioides sp.]|uniref:hypothetical protein n=1 Tax=Nocardioides sp. TaxID=35761 RepID=UPI00286D5059|nr:hypothetical protein [Nocardioides sp.]
MARYTERLDSRVALVAGSITYPLDRSARQAVTDLSRQASANKAVVVLALQPSTPLEQLGALDARRLVTALNWLTERHGTRFLLRFAPEMNGSWTPWGQRPRAYVAAFRDLADAVHTGSLAAETVWAPAYGAGYPFGGSINDVVRGAVVGSTVSPAERRALDTDANGRLDEQDDPYAPYFPGDEAVDWVGLSVLRYGVRQRFGDNTLPGRDELKDRLDDRFGYARATDRESFYTRYADRAGHPMLLLTGALYNPQGPGVAERALKRAWLQRVANAVRFRPQIRAVVWLEDTRFEPEADSIVRWGLAPQRGLGRQMAAALEAGPFDLGPVAPVAVADSGPAGAAGRPGAVPDASSGDDSRRDDTEASSRRAQGAFGLSLPELSALGAATLLLVGGIAALRYRRRQMRPPWL